MKILNIIRDKLEYGRIEAEKAKNETQDYYLKIISDIEKRNQKIIEKIKEEYKINENRNNNRNKEKLNNTIREIKSKYKHRLDLKDIELKKKEEEVQNARKVYEQTRQLVIQLQVASKHLSDYTEYDLMMSAEKHSYSNKVEEIIDSVSRKFFHKEEKHKELLGIDDNNL